MDSIGSLMCFIEISWILVFPCATLAEKSNDNWALPPLEATPWTSSPPSTPAPALVQQWALSCRDNCRSMGLASLLCASHSSPVGWKCLTSSSSALSLEDAPGQLTWIWALLSEQGPHSSQGSICTFTPVFTVPQLKAKCSLSTSSQVTGLLHHLAVTSHVCPAVTMVRTLS